MAALWRTIAQLRRSMKAMLSFALTGCLVVAGPCFVAFDSPRRIEAGGSTVIGSVLTAIGLALMPLLAQLLAFMEILWDRKRPGRGKDKAGISLLFFIPAAWLMMVTAIVFEPPNPRWPLGLQLIGCGFLAIIAFVVVCVPLWGLTYKGYCGLRDAGRWR